MEVLPLRTDGGIEDVIDRYRGMVYGLALAKTGSGADADDVFQEVFLAYFEAGKGFRDEEHRKAWLLRTTLNFARRVTSSTWRRKTAALEDQAELTVPFEEQEEREIWSAVAALSEEYRLPIYLYYFQELSTAEIATVLHVKPGAVRMRLSRGREMLRNVLKGDYFDE